MERRLEKRGHRAAFLITVDGGRQLVATEPLPSLHADEHRVLSLVAGHRHQACAQISKTPDVFAANG